MAFDPRKKRAKKVSPSTEVNVSKATDVNEAGDPIVDEITTASGLKKT